MKVLLNQDIESLGRMGDVVEVARGYARNYLIPKGLAVSVTRGKLKEIEERKRMLKAKAERLRQGLEVLAEQLKSEKLMIKARCSKSGKLFGSITNRHIARAIEEKTGHEIDRHKITIDDRIRMIGTYSAHVKLHPDIEFDLEFEVEGEGFVPEELLEEAWTREGFPKEVPVETQEEAPVSGAETNVDSSEATGTDSS